MRAWRVTSRTFESSLLVRLLPFSSSLERDLPRGVKLVYQSAAGAYLSIYELVDAVRPSAGTPSGTDSDG